MRSFYMLSCEKYPQEGTVITPTLYNARIENVRRFEGEATIREVSEAELVAEGFNPREFTYFSFEGEIGLRSQEGGYAIPCLQLGKDDLRGNYLENELDRMGVPDEYGEGPHTVRAKITVELFFD